MALRAITPDDIKRMIERAQRIPIVPCDSPIEDIFLWEFRKVANHEIRVRRQHECQTRAGRFRLDFVLGSVAGGQQIGIECDGRDFHSAPKDAQRDAAIVGAGVVDKVYRLRGRDIHFRIHDTLHLLSYCEPWLFSERGQTVLRVHCRPDELHEDSTGPSSQHFPFVAIRTYLSPSEVFDDYQDDDEPHDERPKFPTIIYWTERSA